MSTLKSEAWADLHRLAAGMGCGRLLHRAFAAWLTQGGPPQELLSRQPDPRNYEWIALAALAEAATWPVSLDALDEGIDWLSAVSLDRFGVPSPIATDTVAQIAVALAVRTRSRLVPWIHTVVQHLPERHDPLWASRAALAVLSGAPQLDVDVALRLALESVGVAATDARDRHLIVDKVVRGALPEEPLYAVVLLCALKQAGYEPGPSRGEHGDFDTIVAELRRRWSPDLKQAGVRDHELERCSDSELVERAKALYGPDSRAEASGVRTDANFRRNIAATAALVLEDALEVRGDKFHLRSRSLREVYNLCEGEPFANQPTGPYGSAFLVAPNIIATAAHCVDGVRDPSKIRVVFDYEMTPGGARVEFTRQQVFRIRRVAAKRFVAGREDWALLELDGDPARQWLPLRPGGRVNDDARVYVVGHPLGLPKKYAGDARIVNNSGDMQFVTNLDTFGGNSGSPVFDAVTDVVEGILVGGKADFYTTADGCRRATSFSVTEGGEVCCRVTLFADLLASKSLERVQEPGRPLGRRIRLEGSLRRAFRDLLVDLFEPAELRRFVRYGRQGQEIFHTLPEQGVPFLDVVEAVLNAWVQRGLVDDVLFDELVQEREFRKADIEEFRERIITRR